VRRRVGEGEAGGVDGGQERRTAPAAGRQKQSRGAVAQGGRRGRNRARDHFAISEKNRDLTEKNLQLLNQCPNGDGPKAKVHIFSNSTTSL
jgi:hypothetical protein